jgi:hypothetical protein
MQTLMMTSADITNNCNTDAPVSVR